VQVGQQIVDLVLGQHLPEAFHFVAAQADYVADAVIIRGHSACAQVLVFENALQARTFAIFGRVGRVATVAILIVDVAAGGLLWIEAQFGVAPPALDFACRKREKRAEQNGNGNSSRECWTWRCDHGQRLFPRTIHRRFDHAVNRVVDLFSRQTEIVGKN
jgi:hypothetical protein